MADREGILCTKIEANIANYLFIVEPCPHCGKECAISLGNLYKKVRVLCTECRGETMFFLEGQRLNEFVKSFDCFYEQLRKIGLSLMFFHEPYATIWSRDDKS